MFFSAEVIVCFAMNGKSKMFGFSINKRGFRFNSRNIGLWLSAIPFFVVAAIRYNVGTDYIQYSILHIPRVLNGTSTSIELLYQYVIKIGYWIDGTQGIFALTHLLLIFFIWKHMISYSKNLALSIYIFMFGIFYNSSLNLMRQFLAMSICLYALKYIYTKKFWKYLICIIVAGFFHRLAFVMIIFYWCDHIKVNIRKSIIAIIICTLISTPLRNLLIRFTEIFGVYTNYIDTKYDYGTTQIDFLLCELLIFCLANVCTMQASTNRFSIFKVNVQESIKGQVNVLNCFQLVTVLTAALSSIIPNSSRVILLFSLCQITYVPLVLECVIDKRQRFFMSSLFIVLYILIFWRFIVVRGMGETLPYQTIFQ